MDPSCLLTRQESDGATALILARSKHWPPAGGDLPCAWTIQNEVEKLYSTCEDWLDTLEERLVMACSLRRERLGCLLHFVRHS
jgi:hypothetical protein